jgi:HSP20 family protein
MAGNLMRFDPFRELARMDPFRNMDDLFRDFSSMTPALRRMMAEPRIPIDVSETDQAYVVKADIPGVKKEDIKISIEGNEVSIRVATKEEKEEKEGGNTVFSERYYGEQYRSLTLPQAVDDAAAEAKYEDGVLRLTLPKKAGGSSKQITVQ